jgi:glycosyltransferase involved in cell wall biosynthesis
MKLNFILFDGLEATSARRLTNFCERARGLMSSDFRHPRFRVQRFGIQCPCAQAISAVHPGPLAIVNRKLCNLTIAATRLTGSKLAALASVLWSSERLAAMSAAGAKYARHQLTWHGIAHRFDELYQKISGERASSRH